MELEWFSKQWFIYRVLYDFINLVWQKRIKNYTDSLHSNIFLVHRVILPFKRPTK